MQRVKGTISIETLHRRMQLVTDYHSSQVCTQRKNNVLHLKIRRNYFLIESPFNCCGLCNTDSRGCKTKAKEELGDSC